jgi:outer membrane protein
MLPDAPLATLPGDAAPDGACPEKALEGALDLHQVVALALCRNPQARQAWAVAVAQSAQIGEAKAAYLPAVNVNLSHTEDDVTNKVDGARPTSTQSSMTAFGRNMTLSWLLLDFGTRSANIAQSKRLLAAAVASHDAVVQSVFATAAQAYYDTWAANAALDAALDAEKAARENAAAAGAKAKSGAGTHVEELQAHSALSQATLARVRAAGTAKMALGTLAFVLGVDARTPLKLATDPALADPQSEDPAQGRFLQDLDGLMNTAMHEHPSVVAARAQLDAAQAKRDATIREGLPAVTFNLGRYLNGRPTNPLQEGRTYETLASVNVQIPVFEGFSRNYKIREADAIVAAREADLANTEVQASLDVWRNYQTLLVETTAISASADLVRGGDEAYAAARAAYGSGALDILELLNTQKDLASAKQERIRALAAWRTARLKLLGSLGRLGFWALDATQQ